MKTIKEETPQFINNLLLELIHYYMKSIGQSINKDEQMVNITLTELSKYIFKHHLSYTMQEIREAFSYGRDNDQTQGGAIYAQRMIFWLKNYHQDIWLKKNKTAIHNGTFNKPVEPEKRLATSRNVSLEFIKDQQRKHLNGEFAMLAACYETLDRMGKIQVSTEAKWNIVKRACENLLKEQEQLNDLFKFRNVKKEVEAVEIGNNKTVTPRIKAECQRILVGDLFEIEEF
jgi:hypothetical protein